MSKISENLKILRLIKGYSVRQVAQKVDRSPGSISNWENGKVVPDIESVIKLCELYNVSLNQMVGREPCELIDNYISDKKNKLEAMEALIAQKLEIEEQIKKYKKDLSVPGKGPDVLYEYKNPVTNEVETVIIETMKPKP